MILYSPHKETLWVNIEKDSFKFQLASSDAIMHFSHKCMEICRWYQWLILNRWWSLYCLLLYYSIHLWCEESWIRPGSQDICVSLRNAAISKTLTRPSWQWLWTQQRRFVEVANCFLWMYKTPWCSECSSYGWLWGWMEYWLCCHFCHQWRLMLGPSSFGCVSMDREEQGSWWAAISAHSIWWW